MKRITRIFIISGLILSIITLSCKKEILNDDNSILPKMHGQGHFDDRLSNEVIIKWSNTAFEAAGGALEGHPLLASRIEAMMHIAIHDALNAINPVYEQYAYKSHQCHSANPFAAAASAAHTVLKAS